MTLSKNRSYLTGVTFFAVSASLALAACKKEKPEATLAQTSAPAPQTTGSPIPQAAQAPSCDAIKAQVTSIARRGPYAQVRAKLIAAGWVPNSHAKAPTMEDGSEDFATKPAWDAGFREVESCAGAGIAPCTYSFTDKHGNKLKVVGIGEDPPSQQIDKAAVTCPATRGGVGQTTSAGALGGAPSSISSNPRSQPRPSGQTLRVALVRHFGPQGWARCVAGNVSILALVARGDDVPANFVRANDGLGNLLSAMRNEMLSSGTPEGVLDNLVRANSSQIRSGDDAVQVVSGCMNEAAAVSDSLKH